MTAAAGHHHRIAAEAQEVLNNHPAVAADYIVIAGEGILGREKKEAVVEMEEQHCMRDTVVAGMT